MMADKVFSRFYTTPVNIYRIKRGSSYSKDAQTYLVCSVWADVQPYGGVVDERERGVTLGKSFKMYCENNSAVKEGCYAEFDGDMYRIVSVKRWSTGIEAFIKCDVL